MYVRMIFMLWGGKDICWHRQHTHAQYKLNDGDHTDKVDKGRSVNCNVFFLWKNAWVCGKLLWVLRDYCQEESMTWECVWTSWTLGAWRFLITFPIVLIWDHWISTHSPKLRSAFQSLHFQTDGDVRVEFRHWLCLQYHQDFDWYSTVTGVATCTVYCTCSFIGHVCYLL